MDHYINDYSNLWVFIVELEMDKEVLNVAKSSLEAENAFLNKLASEEAKIRERAEDWEKELKQELSMVRGWLDMIAWEHGGL